MGAAGPPVGAVAALSRLARFLLREGDNRSGPAGRVSWTEDSMNRRIVAIGVVLVVIFGMLGLKIWQQHAALNGPAGGSGTIEGTTVRVSSRVGGRIEEIPVREGQQVAKGDLVVRLDCVEPEAALAEAEAKLAAGRQQAAAADGAAGAAKAAAGAAGAVAKAAQAQADAAATQGGAAARQAGRLDAVVDDISAAQRDQARSAAEGAQAKAAAAMAQRAAGSAQARAATEQAGAAQSQAEAAHLQVDAGEAALERAKLAVSECKVVAPRAGTLQLLPFEEGELVPPGANLATIVDTSTATAAFYLPNADLAAARPGGAAEVRADAWLDRVFQGKVATVASEAEFTPRNIQTRTDRDRLVYRVEVDIDNPDGDLRPGMPVEVRLVGTP